MAKKIKKAKPVEVVAPSRTWASPIELGMRNALCTVADVEATGGHLTDYSTAPQASRLTFGPCGGSVVPAHKWTVKDGRESWDSEDHGVYRTLYAGVSFRSYRLDFVMLGDHSMLAIECDGHDWHEKTKQQASADRARDRELLLHGVQTIRFTGSDIFNYAIECATDVFRIIAHLDGLVARFREDAAHAHDAGLRAGFDNGAYQAFRDGLDVGFRRGIQHFIEATSIDEGDGGEHW